METGRAKTVAIHLSQPRTLPRLFLALQVPLVYSCEEGHAKEDILGTQVGGQWVTAGRSEGQTSS